MAKQAVLEAVQSERSSLHLQLERANKLLENGPSSTSEGADGSSRVLLNITDDGKTFKKKFHSEHFVI